MVQHSDEVCGVLVAGRQVRPAFARSSHGERREPRKGAPTEVLPAAMRQVP